MSSSDDKPRVLKTDLLDELQSIKGLLVDPTDTGRDQHFEFEHLDDDLGGRATNPGASDGLSHSDGVDQDHGLELDQGLNQELDQNKSLGLDLDLDLELDLERELDLDRELDINIPILDDVVTAQRDIADGVFNLDPIFNPQPASVSSVEANDSMPLAADVTYATASTAAASGNSLDHNQPSAGKAVPPDIVFLIQELVDEFIPLIEDRLRSRLSELHPDILQDLAQKHLNP